MLFLRLHCNVGLPCKLGARPARGAEPAAAADVAGGQPRGGARQLAALRMALRVALPASPHVAATASTLVRLAKRRRMLVVLAMEPPVPAREPTPTWRLR